MNDGPHVLLTTLVASIGLSFLLGAAAQKMKLSPIVGYLLAGVLVGPHTPGWTGDPSIALQFSEIGVILLMFGVGLHFSPKELWAVRSVAVPGALVQMAAAGVLGYALGIALKLPAGEAVTFGLALSVASTVVLVRALEEHHLLQTDGGRLAIGWLVVEDAAIVAALVLLPAVAQASVGASPDLSALFASLAWALAKIAVFVALMLVVGARVLPWLLTLIAHSRSRELMGLAVLAIALGIAYLAYALFDASFALGAFLAGLVLNGTKLTQRVAEQSLPLRDTFAVLFFVSVGMLFDPMIFVEEPWATAGAVAIVMIGKAAAALGISALFRLPAATGALIAASLAQIGEFSFILASVGRQLGLVSDRMFALVLVAAIISIALNPLAFWMADQVRRRTATEPAVAP